VSADLQQLFARSEIVRTAGRAIAIVRAAANSSAVAVLLARARSDFSSLRPAHRVRVAGVLVAIALATDELLLLLVPAQPQPSPPSALRLEIALAALVLILAAAPIARAWPTSRLRRLLMSSL
jgi:hypothetical protein